MGVLKNLVNGAKSVKGAVAGTIDMMKAAEAEAANAPITILHPTPQVDVDRMLAAGGVTRGVVVRASHAEQSGDRASRMRVDVRVRGRLTDGELGPEAKLKVWTSWKVAALLDPGLEIPILLDRATGVATEIVADELRRELEHRFDESAKRRPGWTIDL